MKTVPFHHVMYDLDFADGLSQQDQEVAFLARFPRYFTSSDGKSLLYTHSVSLKSPGAIELDLLSANWLGFRPN